MSQEIKKLWPEITQLDASLAPLTVLKMGGKAAALVTPRNDAELQAVYQHCLAKKIKMHWLAMGGNVLAREEGVTGVVIRLSHEHFSTIKISKNNVIAGGATNLSKLIHETARKNLTGLEGFVGIPGTVGGALVSQIRSRTGTFSQATHSLDVINAEGKFFTISREDFQMDQSGDAPSMLILRVNFQLQEDAPEPIVKRLKKAWISTKSKLPVPFQNAVRLFRDPAISTASSCISQAGAQKLKSGGASLSERDPNYVVVNDKARPADVLKLMEQVREQVRSTLGQNLHDHLVIW